MPLISFRNCLVGASHPVLYPSSGFCFCFLGFRPGSVWLVQPVEMSSSKWPLAPLRTAEEPGVVPARCQLLEDRLDAITNDVCGGSRSKKQHNWSSTTCMLLNTCSALVGSANRPRVRLVQPATQACDDAADHSTFMRSKTMRVHGITSCMISINKNALHWLDQPVDRICGWLSRHINRLLHPVHHICGCSSRWPKDNECFTSMLCINNK